METMLEARSLSVLRGAAETCSGVNLRVRRGGCHGIIGPNGSGKSTLLLGLRGLLPTRGDLAVAGIAPRSAGRARMARLVAVMPQRMEFAFPFTVEEMVLLGRSPHRRPWEAFRAEDRARARALIERLGLAPVAGMRVDAVSGGERRKVFLARALAQDTPLLFLDEPTAGLDPAVQEELVALIEELRQSEGRTVVVVLHDVRLARRLCERVTALRAGVELAEGVPERVLAPDLLEALFGVRWVEFSAAGRTPVLLPAAAEEKRS
ncbi:MAG: ABC transporter ATP-binding protein [Planctomycetes bacterium]|nr:ABC transporter ATP-binding protein [Planctomycetota bacterium]